MIIQILSNVLYLVYLYTAQPFVNPRQTKLSLANESAVLVVSCCLLGFTDQVCTDSDTQDALGWFVIAWINVVAGCNMLIAMVKTGREVLIQLRKRCGAKIASEEDVLDENVAKTGDGREQEAVKPK